MDALREGFSIGIEEEYLLVDPETRALSVRQPSGFMARCKELLGPRVAHEVLQSQIEIVSRVCANIGEARTEILELLMSQVSYFMPHLLALSTSSPFWEGHDTGLKAFRPIIIGDLPRSGLPETFESWNDWTEMLDDLAATGMVTDPSKIWWDLRPSARHPTLEIRICDICTWAEDGLTIAALYQSILAFLYSLRANNQRWRQYRRILILENKWRAQRYGVEAEMGDFGKRALVPFSELIDELVEILRPHAAALGCLAEVEHARTIARRGTSADHQLRVYKDALGAGAGDHEAQVAVVDWLMAQSARADGAAPD